MKFITYSASDHPVNEAELLEKFRINGDLQVLGELYGRYMPLVYGLCLKYLKDEELAKDAVMEIFEQLVKKLRVHQVSNFKSWLYTLVRNFCLMEIRRSERHPTSSLDETSMENVPFLHHTDAEPLEERLKQMERCIELLPEGQREAVRLFYLEEKCYKEIVLLTSFDMNQVKSYIQNGKRNLKICLEKNSGE